MFVSAAAETAAAVGAGGLAGAAPDDVAADDTGSA